MRRPSHSVIQQIGERLANAGSIVEKCREGKAGISMRGYPHRIVLKPESPGKGRKICDCIIFALKDHVLFAAVVEFKGKTTPARHIREQLSSCAEVCVRILESVDTNNCERVCVPILVAKAYHSSEFKVLSKMKIGFGTKSVLLRLAKHGGKNPSFGEVVELFSQ